MKPLRWSRRRQRQIIPLGLRRPSVCADTWIAPDAVLIGDCNLWDRVSDVRLSHLCATCDALNLIELCKDLLLKVVVQEMFRSAGVHLEWCGAARGLEQHQSQRLFQHRGPHSHPCCQVKPETHSVHASRSTFDRTLSSNGYREIMVAVVKLAAGAGLHHRRLHRCESIELLWFNSCLHPQILANGSPRQHYNRTARGGGPVVHASVLSDPARSCHWRQVSPPSCSSHHSQQSFVLQ